MRKVSVGNYSSYDWFKLRRGEYWNGWGRNGIEKRECRLGRKEKRSMYSASLLSRRFLSLPCKTLSDIFMSKNTGFPSQWITPFVRPESAIKAVSLIWRSPSETDTTLKRLQRPFPQRSLGGVSKTRGRGLPFLKECCFRVRVRVEAGLNKIRRRRKTFHF